MSHYDKLADRAFGATKLKYMDLSIEYLEVEINKDKFPAYKLVNGWVIKQ